MKTFKDTDKLHGIARGTDEFIMVMEPGGNCYCANCIRSSMDLYKELYRLALECGNADEFALWAIDDTEENDYYVCERCATDLVAKAKGIVYTNKLTGHTFKSKVEWQTTMAVGSGEIAKDNNISDTAVVSFIFGDGMIVTREPDGRFYSIACNEEILTDSAQDAIDWLWNELYVTD